MAADRSDQVGAALDLQVLGAFAVRHEGKPLDLPRSRKTRALLAYLAVVDQPQSRERLCTMFWDTPDDLRGALRWSLSKIRKIVNIGAQDVLTADRNVVTLRTQSLAVDFRKIRELSQRLASSDIVELEEAAGVLKSGFLEDLSLPRCREFEAWRLLLANEVGLLRATILRTLVDRLAAEPSRALPHAFVLQSMEPTNSGLAAEVKALAESARGLAVKAPERPDRPPSSNHSATVPVQEAFTDGERQEVTILSIEIVSPLHGFASLAPDVVLRELDPLFESTHELVERHGGMVSASGSSGITALFCSTIGENHAVAACRAALAVKATIESQSSGSVRVRAGLDTGEVIVRYRHQGMTRRIEVTGTAVRTAGRLMHTLRRGVLALTDRTQVVAAGLMETRLLPRSEFPRFARDGQVYELLSEAARKPF
jgi:DNA-binding SARP family transcriptional activator/class 3 adenylate cyclase